MIELVIYHLFKLVQLLLLEMKMGEYYCKKEQIKINGDFLGDASSTTEKEIINKYNLPDIDVLKVGHH